MRPLSGDLRTRIVAARKAGAGVGEVAQRFGVSRSSVERFWRQHRQRGHVRPGQIGGYRQSRLQGHDRQLRRWIAVQADLTLAELRARCLAELGVRIGQTALWHRLEKLGLSYKKTTHAAEQQRPDIRVARRHWRRAQPGWASGQLVFIDETGLNTRMARLYGRSLRRRRCVAAVPQGHWRTSTLIAALRVDGLGAPFLIEGAVNAEVFAAYLRHVLCPELKPGDVVILDNLSSHKSPAVAALVGAAGATVRYLPAYSPDLNPIEMAFAKLKAHLRQAAARTLVDLESAVVHALRSFQPAHCQAFFRHARYASI